MFRIRILFECRLTRHFLILFARNKFVNWSASRFINHMAKRTRGDADSSALNNEFTRLFEENNNEFRNCAAVFAKSWSIFKRQDRHRRLAPRQPELFLPADGDHRRAR